MAKKDDKLTPREAAFVRLLLDPADRRTIDAKAHACGWKGARFGYRVAKRPRVRAAIERETATWLLLARVRLSAVMGQIHQLAITGDLKACRIYLEACGIIGGGRVQITNNVTATRSDDADADSGFELRIMALREGARRGETLG